MHLSPGTRLGPYTVDILIGSGGMGEVYRAHDERLRRDVAVKVLPPEFADDEGRLQRFAQEARSAGGLSHPNVLTVHDIGTHEGAPYLVSELLQGETLRERLASSGRIPPRKACEYAAQAARGLGAAHAQSIVHRDLKPDNLFITRDDRVKILDFGLAKLTDEPLVGAGDAETVTLGQGTEPGVILGTVGYMAPEQVRGEASDYRADIFALGAVLYEMLTGERAFTGDSAVSTLNAILVEEPPEPSTKVAGVSKAHDEIVRHCLEKGAEQRFQSAQDLAFQLELLSGASSTSQLSGDTLEAVEAAPKARSRKGLIAVGLLGAAVLGASGGWLARQQPTTPLPVRLRPITYSGGDLSPAVSPDGKTLAFVSTRDGVSQIWLKRLPGGDEVALTAGPDQYPRFSPDGSEILFGRSEALYRVPVIGGTPRRVADGSMIADWTSRGDRIAFVRIDNQSSKLFVMSTDGSEERLIYEELARMATDVRWSPDGTRLAVPFVHSGANVSDPKILLVDVETGESRMLEAPRGAGQPIGVDWSGDGDSLIYTQALSQTPIADQNILVRHHLPTDRSEILTYIEGVPWAISVAGEGKAVVGLDSMRSNLQIVDLDDGASRWLTLGDSLDRQPVFSPDGAWVTFSTNRAGNIDIYSMNAESGEVRRLTDHPGTDWDPAFTPDGRNLVFSSDREGHFEIWMAEADGRNPRRITEDGYDAENGTISPDGKWLVYNSAHPEKSGVWKRHLETGEEAQLFQGLTGVPEISPDGRWVLTVRSSSASASTIDVVSLEDGAPAPFSIGCSAEGSLASSILVGRSRWLPDGSGIAFLCHDETGRLGVLAQDFVPGQETRSTRRLLAGQEEDRFAESFGLSPDGQSIVLSLLELRQSLLLAENLPGVSRPSAGGSRGD